MKCSFKMVQLLTGHGNYQDYLRIFKLAEVDGLCDCGRRSENVEHVRSHCLGNERIEIRDRIQNEYQVLEVNIRRNNRCDEMQLRKVTAWSEVCLTQEDYRPMEDDDNEERDETDE